MNKKLLISIFLLAGLIRAEEQHKTFEDYIEAHRKAFEEVTPYISKLSYETHVVYAGRHTQTVYSYHGEPEAKTAWTKYQAAYNDLNARMVIQSSGDGFMLGSGIGLATKIIGGREVNLAWAITSVIASSIILKLYHNKQINHTAYYDQTLKRQEDLFAQISLRSVGHMFTAMITSGVGFAGTVYAYNRLAKLRA